MNCDAPKGVYKDSVFKIGGKKATGKNAPPKIIFVLSSNHLIELTSSIQKENSPSKTENWKVKIKQSITTIGKVQRKCNVKIFAGVPIEIAIARKPKNALRRKTTNLFPKYSPNL